MGWKSAMWKQMSGFRVVSSEARPKGRINIWVRCIKQRFSVGVSTLRRGFWFQWLGGCAQTETKSPQTFLLLGSEHFQMCHSVDVNELAHLTRNAKMRNRGDNLSLFTAAPVKASAPGWKITGNCRSHWIQFGFGWKTKITKLWLLKRQGQGARRPCC